MRHKRPHHELMILFPLALLAGALFAHAADASPTSQAPLLLDRPATPTMTATATVTASATVTATCEITCTATLTATFTAVPTQETIPATRPTDEQTIVPPTRTVTPTVTPTLTPAPNFLPLLFRTGYLLENGGFESASLMPGWQAAGDLPVAVVSSVRHSGEHAVLLGDPDYDIWGGCPVGEAAIEQFIRVPRQGHPRLWLWYRVVTYDTYQFDHFAIEIKRWPSGEPDVPLLVGGLGFGWTPGSVQDLLWQEADISLDGYRGEMIRVRLYNAMTNADGYYNTWTYVDDVAIEILP